MYSCMYHKGSVHFVCTDGGGACTADSGRLIKNQNSKIEQEKKEVIGRCQVVIIRVHINDQTF